MKTVAFVVVGSGLIAGAFYTGMLVCPPGHVCILESNTDPSPIIVTDGGSIHFSQFDQWVYVGSRELAALQPGHHAHSVKVGLCTQTLGSSTASNCGTNLIDQKVSGKSWKLLLCQTNCLTDGSNAVSILSLDKNSTWGQDKGTDLVVAGNGYDFQSEPRTVDGASFRLDSVHFRFARLIVEGVLPGTTADCSASNPSGNACVARICYAAGQSKCP